VETSITAYVKRTTAFTRRTHDDIITMRTTPTGSCGIIYVINITALAAAGRLDVGNQSVHGSA